MPKLGGGGGERVVSILANKLVDKNYKVTIALFKNCHDNEYINNLDVRVKIEYVNFYGRVSRNPIGLLFKLIFIIRFINPDVVFFGSGSINAFMSPFLWMLPKNIKKVARETNLVSFYEKSQILKMLYRTTLKFYDVVIFQSMDMANNIQQYAKLPKHKYCIINNPIDTDYIDTQKELSFKSPKCNSNQIKLVTAGRLTYQKNYLSLIRTLSQIRDVNFKLDILGSGEDEDDIISLIEKLSMGDKVSLKGNVSNPYVFFSEADFFISSSLWEGFPNVVIESLYCGTPVISNNYLGGINEIIDERLGRVIDIENHQELRAAILSKYANSDVISKVAKERYNIDEIIKKYESQL